MSPLPRECKSRLRLPQEEDEWRPARRRRLPRRPWLSWPRRACRNRQRSFARTCRRSSTGIEKDNRKPSDGRMLPRCRFRSPGRERVGIWTRHAQVTSLKSRCPRRGLYPFGLCSQGKRVPGTYFALPTRAAAIGSDLRKITRSISTDTLDPPALRSFGRGIIPKTSVPSPDNRRAASVHVDLAIERGDVVAHRVA